VACSLKPIYSPTKGEHICIDYQNKNQQQNFELDIMALKNSNPKPSKMKERLTNAKNR